MTGMLAPDLDHVAIAVWDADEAAAFFTTQLKLEVTGDEIADEPGVRLVYLGRGRTAIQLVQPIRDDAPVAEWLRTHDEGLHHICFRTDDLRACSEILTSLKPGAPFRAGRGVHAFFLDHEPSGVKVEITGPLGGAA